MKNGLFIIYDLCTGCHTCELACQKEHHFPHDQYGVTIFQDGPRKNVEGKWDYTFLPVPTLLCDLCADRVETGKLPTCVHHCPAGVMRFDTVENLTHLLDEHPRSCVFSPE